MIYKFALEKRCFPHTNESLAHIPAVAPAVEAAAVILVPGAVLVKQRNGAGYVVTAGL